MLWYCFPHDCFRRESFSYSNNRIRIVSYNKKDTSLIFIRPSESNPPKEHLAKNATTYFNNNETSMYGIFTFQNGRWKQIKKKWPRFWDGYTVYGAVLEDISVPKYFLKSWPRSSTKPVFPT